MRITIEPRVYLVGKQVVDIEALGGFLAIEAGLNINSSEFENAILDRVNPGEHLAEIAGRTCYMSFENPRPGGASAYFKRILESGHGSVIEHVVFSFIFCGISRTCSHELVRHRSGWSYSQLSQRYVDESESNCVIPAAILADQEAATKWREECILAQGTYRLLCDRLEALLTDVDMPKTEKRKAVRQAARSVLPNATETKIFVTANARALRHFLEMRCSRHAEPEIRGLAGKVHGILVREAPNLFGDYQRVDLPDGSFELTTPYRKV